MNARDRVLGTLQDPAISTQVAQAGYVTVSGVLNRHQIRGLISSLESSLSHRSRAGVRHLLGNPEVARLASDERMLGLAQQILGSDAFPFRATLFDKSPDSNWLIPWHQHTALPLCEKHESPGWGPWSVKDGVAYAHAPASALGQVVALRLHLDDSTAENGPLRVLPGTHRLGLLRDDEVEAILATGHPETCLAPLGGIIVMRPLLIHASSKLRSGASRRVLHIEYATPSAVPAPLQLALV